MLMKMVTINGLKITDKWVIVKNDYNLLFENYG
jgi:hypothetical protein